MHFAVTVTCLVINDIIDNTNNDPVAIMTSGLRIGIEFGKVGTVLKRLDRLKHKILFDSRQQICLATDDRFDQVVAEEISVPEQQHIVLEVANQHTRHRNFPPSNRLDQITPQNVAADLTE